MEITRSEHGEQQAFFDWARLNEGKYPELELLYAIPNMGKRSYATANYMRSEGMRSGVPDIHLPVARGKYIGWWRELKTDTGRPTANQKKWIKRLSEHGHDVGICHGCDELIDEVTKYLDQKR